MNLKIVFLWIVPVNRERKGTKTRPHRKILATEKALIGSFSLRKRSSDYTNLQKPSRTVDSECVNRCERLFFPQAFNSTLIACDMIDKTHDPLHLSTISVGYAFPLRHGT